MPSPDLTAGTRAVEELMSDACIITTNPGGVDDGLVDQSTGALDDLAPAAYGYQGPCLLQDTAGSLKEEVGATYVSGPSRLLLPITALRENPGLEPHVGDAVLMTASKRDPRLVGRRFAIVDVVLSTFAVARDCTVELRG